MGEEKQYLIPEPIVDKKEEDLLVKINEKYEKITSPGIISKAGKKVVNVIPQSVKDAAKTAKDGISEKELFTQCMKVVAEGFGVIEKQAAKMTVSEKTITKKLNKLTKENEITNINEICLVRGYDISKLVSKYKTQDLALALLEGAGTGALGFAGLPFNIVLSTFLYYRAVQTVAMYYGYDVKNDASELMIAGDVFINALGPKSKGSNEVGNIIAKIMVMTESTVVKQTVKKTWADMASRGGVCLLITQMRALANKSAQKALEKVGEKGLEESVFRSVFEQIGKKLTKKAIGTVVPVIGALIGGCFDTAVMSTVIEYANLFYNKRYILEKEVRINELVECTGNENKRFIVQSNLQLITYPKCSTCQKTKKWLKEHKIEFTERNILEENPTSKELKNWYKMSGLPLKKLFNTNGKVYKEMQLKDKLPNMSEKEMLKLLASDGMLIKRPLLIMDEKVLVGFKESEWEKLIENIE